MPTTGQSRRFRFTHQLIADLPPHDPASPSREAEYSDEEVRGLRLLVSKTNRKTFFLRYVLDQRKGVVRIGEWPAMSLKDARTRAHELKGRIAHGEDPREDKALRVAMPTVEEFALGDYLQWAKVHKRSWRDDEIRLHKEILPRIGKRRLSDLTTRDVQAIHLAMKETHAAATCNRYLALVQRMLSYAIEMGVIEVNVAKRCKKLAENNARQRYLSSAEISALLKALDGLANRSIAAAVKFLLFTGLRKGEALTLRWENVQREQATVFLPKTKNGTSRTVLLNSLAQGVIEEMWAARKDDHPFVFPGKCKGKGIINPQRPFAEACKMAGLEGIVLHHLRHTFASISISSGATLYDVQRLLGHSQSSTTQRYAHLQTEAARRASENVARQINQAEGREDIASSQAA